MIEKLFLGEILDRNSPELSELQKLWMDYYNAEPLTFNKHKIKEIKNFLILFCLSLLTIKSMITLSNRRLAKTKEIHRIVTLIFV